MLPIDGLSNFTEPFIYLQPFNINQTDSHISTSSGNVYMIYDNFFYLFGL